MRVEEIMARDVVFVTPETSLKAVASVLSEHGISGVPVCRGDEVVGVVSESDILRLEKGIDPTVGGLLAWVASSIDGELDRVAARTAGQAMGSPAVTIRPHAHVWQAACLLVERRVNRLVVVDEGKLVGIVSRSDLVRAFARMDEEIENEIREDVLAGILLLEPDRFTVAVDDGTVRITGTADSPGDAATIVQLVRRVPGVVDVHAHIDSAPRARAEFAEFG